MDQPEHAVLQESITGRLEASGDPAILQTAVRPLKTTVHRISIRGSPFQWFILPILAQLGSLKPKSLMFREIGFWFPDGMICN